jgi:hypothetical protein
VIKRHGGIHFLHLGAPSKTEIKGHSKGFLEAVSSFDPELAEFDLIFVGEHWADGSGRVPLQNHRGWWQRGGAMQPLGEETSCTAPCNVAEASQTKQLPKTPAFHVLATVVFHTFHFCRS